MLQSILVLLGTIVGALAAIGGQLISEKYRRRCDRQMIARALAGSIQATLMMNERRNYVTYFQGLLQRIDRREQVEFDKLLRNASVDPITERMLDRVGMLGGNLPSRIIEFMFVLTSIRIDLVRMGAGEFDQNTRDAAHIIREDLKIWDEFEPKARILVKDILEHAKASFSFLPWK